MEFKVGQIYEVTDKCFYHSARDKDKSEMHNIIKITGIHDNWVLYETLKGTKPIQEDFEIGSIFSKHLRLVNQKIVITTNGKTTFARLYDGDKVVKTAEAKCNPSDEFDFETGAKLAFERLFAKEFFVNGRRYIFDLGKYTMCRNEEATPKWAYEVAGNPVEVLSETRGKIQSYSVTPDWCIEAPDETIIVGDLVRIIDGGRICSKYYVWVEKYIDDKHLIALWSYGKNPYYKNGQLIETNDTFEVIAIADGRAFIKNSNDECYVISLGGLRKE